MTDSIRTDDPDAIVVLRAVQDLSCSKTFFKDGNKIGVSNYGQVRTWVPSAISIKTFDAFEKALQKLALTQNCIIIRDALIDENKKIAPEIGMVRKANGPQATLKTVPRKWVALDIDGLEAPGTMCGSSQKEFVVWARQQLPAMFNEAACWYQFTSSYLISTEPEVLRLRLWFLLDTPVISKTWKMFFKGNSLKIDTALFHPVQPHYIAAPRFDGIKPPIKLKERFGRLGGKAQVNIDDVLDTATLEGERADTRDMAAVDVDGNEAQIEQRIEIILGQETDGSRHHHAFGAAAELLSVGCPVDKIQETLVTLINKQGRDENAAHEVADIIKAAISKQKAGELKSSVKPINDLFDDGEFDEAGETDEADDDEIDFSGVYSSEGNSMYNALVYLKRNHEDGGFLRWMQDDYTWDGKCWTMQELETFESLIAIDSQLASHKVSAIAKSIRQLMYRPGLVHRCLIDTPHKSISPYVVFQNGMLFLADYLMDPLAQLEPHDRRYFNPVALPYNYNPDAQCPQFLKFIDDCFGSDEEQKRECRKMFGYLVSQGNDHQKFFMLQGPTRAGKGVMMGVLRGLMGEVNIASPLLANLGNDFALQPLLKKSLIIIDEANEQSSKNITSTVVDLIKAVTGGSAVQVNRKNRDALDNIQLPGRFLVACNRPPAFLDPSGALGARLVMFRFVQSFLGREDMALGLKLRSELPGIFNWALEGLYHLDITDQRFLTPASVREYLAATKDVMQPVTAFADECLLQHDTDDHSLPIDDMYAIYRHWCVENGRGAYSKQRLCSEIIHTMKVKKSRPRVGDSRKTVYTHLGLTPTGADYLKGISFD